MQPFPDNNIKNLMCDLYNIKLSGFKLINPNISQPNCHTIGSVHNPEIVQLS